jgi:hypothetical protein
MDRRSRGRSQRTLLLGTAALALHACQDSPTKPFTDRVPDIPRTPVVLTRPAAVTPVGGLAIAQNQPATGCAYNERAGYGHRIEFRWTPTTASHGLAGYEVVAQQADATRPIVSTFVDTQGGLTTLEVTFCGSYVVDSNLEGWSWRVRARDELGNFSDWSEPGTFRFEPCRLGRRVCGSV